MPSGWNEHRFAKDLTARFHTDASNRLNGKERDALVVLNQLTDIIREHGLEFLRQMIMEAAEKPYEEAKELFVEVAMSFQRDEYFEIREYVENNNPDAEIPELAELFAAEYRIRHKEDENSAQMNELLKRSEFDIYDNPNVSDEGINKFAEVIAADKSIALNKYFDLLKFSSKFCWLNYLNIIEKLPEEDRIRGLSILFELLQDSNWPTYKKTMSLFDKMDKKVIDPYLKKYLAQAYAEDDEMWINNLEYLAERESTI